MKTKLLLSLCAVFPLACGTDQLRFESENHPVVLTGTGGDSSSSQGGAPGELVETNQLRRGGYGGGWLIASDSEPAVAVYPPSPFEVCDEGWGLEAYLPDTCRAGTLCSVNDCVSDAQCQSEMGTQAARCNTWSPPPDLEAPERRQCIVPCSSDEACGEGMICETVNDSSEKTCLFSDIPWAPGCDGFCLEENDDFEVLCGVDAPCCEGLSCSPNGQCQARECLEFAWACGDETAPCCDGLSCVGGYCQSNP